MRSVYSSLQSDISELDEAIASIKDHEDTLDTMTRGTKEWRNEAEALNQEVLELIEKYPQLAAMLTTNNGIMSIDFDGENYRRFRSNLDRNQEITRRSVLYQQEVTLDSQSTAAIAAFNERNNTNLSLSDFNVPVEDLIDNMGGLSNIDEDLISEIVELYRTVELNNTATDNLTQAIHDSNPNIFGSSENEDSRTDEEIVSKYLTSYSPTENQAVPETITTPTGDTFLTNPFTMSP